MRNIDTLLKEARSLAPRRETDFRLHTVNVIYTPDTMELPPGMDPPGLDPGQALVWLKLFGKDTGAVITTEAILILWDELQNFIKLITQAFPPVDNQTTIIALPAKLGEPMPDSFIDFRGVSKVLEGGKE